MKKKPTELPGSQLQRGTQTSGSASRGTIHPVVIYPFRQATDYSDLEELYRLVARLDGTKDKYARPITVMDRKTVAASAGDKRFAEFREQTVGRHSDLMEAWCVDTCQMWYNGLGQAFEQGATGDVYWLIPGDFNYGAAVGRDVLARLHDLPEIILELKQDLCIGEITADPSHSKHLIDTYGTFALLYNWFPTEAQEVRRLTERPRSEFFALGHGFLQEVLRQRWFAYEQTVVMLLLAVFGNKKTSRFCVGDVSDLPQGREPFAWAVQQVERTERVLKTLWLERSQLKPGWKEEYQRLDAASGQIRRGALNILQNLLA